MTSEPPHLPASLAFELRDVTLRYATSKQPVLQKLNFAVPSGQFVAIVGPSGCGKSTILKLLAGLMSPSSGQLVHHSGRDSIRNRTGFVFQHPTLLPWRTAAENLQLPLELGKTSNAQLSARDCSELLQQVGLQETDAAKRPSELSGGMQMRLSLARALATKPEVLLLDEPFAAVDDLLRLKLQEDVRRIHDQRGLTTILVTHNLHEAVFLGDRVLVMSGSPSSVVDDVLVEAAVLRESMLLESPVQETLVPKTLANSPSTGPNQRSRSALFRESSEFHEALLKVSRSLFAPATQADSVPGVASVGGLPISPAGPESAIAKEPVE